MVLACALLPLPATPAPIPDLVRAPGPPLSGVEPGAVVAVETCDRHVAALFAERPFLPGLSDLGVVPTDADGASMLTAPRLQPLPPGAAVPVRPDCARFGAE
ncbi:MAG: hypothetical protein EXR71_02770 [Myxococcales bacterium]|nr:hypothetical protein [Myxococcales bacterium]